LITGNVLSWPREWRRTEALLAAERKQQAMAAIREVRALKDPNMQPAGRRVRRAYLAYVFAGPAIVGLLGVALIAIALFSSQPTPIRVTELPVGALMVIVAVFMPRMSGPLEFSIFRSSFKANLDATLSEALLLAREAAVQVQPSDDPKKEQKADEAVQRVLYLYTLRLWDAEHKLRDISPPIRAEYREWLRALERRPAGRLEGEKSTDKDREK
jgi:hypothetical protein